VTGISKKDVGRCYKFIVQSLEKPSEVIKSESFMVRSSLCFCFLCILCSVVFFVLLLTLLIVCTQTRFCNRLGMNSEEERAASEVARRAVELGIVAG
jgi:transcription initiation factor TFIIIB Brf1 subunit/transcription initiation factor TFIIB